LPLEIKENMATQKQHYTWLIMISGILILALSRVIPHPWNFTPIAGIALFGGASFKNKKLAFLLPLAGMLLSDCILELFSPGNGFHSSMLYVYSAFIMITILGFGIRKYAQKPAVLLSASLISTIIFFLVTNFGTWAAQNLYPHTFGGLMECYVAGLAFLKLSFHESMLTSIILTLCGDLFFTGLFFGSQYLLNRESKYKTA